MNTRPLYCSVTISLLSLKAKGKAEFLTMHISFCVIARNTVGPILYYGIQLHFVQLLMGANTQTKLFRCGARLHGAMDIFQIGKCYTFHVGSREKAYCSNVCKMPLHIPAFQCLSFSKNNSPQKDHQTI